MTSGLTYDTGALIAAERSKRILWSLHRAALARGVIPVIPGGVLAEAWRGGPQALLSRLLKGCHVEPLGREQARATGALAARVRTAQIVDASVVECALRQDHAVVTSDPHDIEAIAGAIGRSLVVHVV